MENKFEPVDFEILSKTELQKEVDSVKAQVEKIRATSDEMTAEIRRKIDILNEQRNATENKCWDDIARLRRQYSKAMEYQEKLELKAKFDKRVEELTRDYGEQDYFYIKSSYGGDACIKLGDGLYIKFGYSSFDVCTPDGESICHRYFYSNEKLYKDVLEFVKKAFEGKTLKDLQEEAKKNFLAELAKGEYSVEEEISPTKYILKSKHGGYRSTIVKFKVTEDFKPILQDTDHKYYEMLSFARRWLTA